MVVTPLLLFISISITVVGSDYTIPISSVTFDANSPIGTQQCLTVDLIDDDGFEGTHNFTISLDDPATPLCQLGSPSELFIVILDNESEKCCLDFNIVYSMYLEKFHIYTI